MIKASNEQAGGLIVADRTDLLSINGAQEHRLPRTSKCSAADIEGELHTVDQIYI
jgi:hypothetical protein